MVSQTIWVFTWCASAVWIDKSWLWRIGLIGSGRGAGGDRGQVSSSALCGTWFAEAGCQGAVELPHGVRAMGCQSIRKLTLVAISWRPALILLLRGVPW